MGSTNQFDWVGFYKELAFTLLQYKENRNGLIAKVYKIFENTEINMPKLETDNKILDIDPFTVFGLFNKSKMKESNRVMIITAIAELFDIKAAVPPSFLWADGLPAVPG